MSVTATFVNSKVFEPRRTCSTNLFEHLKGAVTLLDIITCLNTVFKNVCVELCQPAVSPLLVPLYSSCRPSSPPVYDCLQIWRGKQSNASWRVEGLGEQRALFVLLLCTKCNLMYEWRPRFSGWHHNMIFYSDPWPCNFQYNHLLSSVHASEVSSITAFLACPISQSPQ